jgi:hypothetical protein
MAGGRWEVAYGEEFQEVQGQEVAHELLQVRKFRGRLTSDLERYREYGDISKYMQWLNELREAGDREWPRWDKLERTFYYGDRMYKKLARQSTNQPKVLNALEDAQWHQSGVTVELHKEQVDETLSEMNMWAPIRFYRDEDKVNWVRK